MTGSGVRADTEHGGDKGGGYHGPPRRWTGAGPRPARHVPWPEIFKHHESVLQGHLKMVDMVRKHCVEGTGNYRTADACVERTKKMLGELRDIKRNFVPPRDNIDRVPLGSSSASMYPGYSPADHIYGEAAAEYGLQMYEAKKKGIDFKLDPNGPQYEVGQTNRIRREQLDEIARKRQEAKKLNEEADAVVKVMDAEVEKNPSVVDGAEKPKEDGEEPPLFFVDSNPTPVNLSGQQDTSKEGKKSNHVKKRERRRVSFEDPTTNIPTNNYRPETERDAEKAKIVTADSAKATEVSESKKKKKEKKHSISSDINGTVVASEPSTTEPSSVPKAEGAKSEDTQTLPQPTETKKKKDRKRRASQDADGSASSLVLKPKAKKSKQDAPETQAQPEPVIEHEDITAEVDARLKAKEEKRKSKENKKRKREGDSSFLESEGVAAGSGEVDGKPEKKKAKKKVEPAATEGSAAGKKREADGEDGIKKRKKKKGKKGTAEEA